jgi:hypothetical protein
MDWALSAEKHCRVEECVQPRESFERYVPNHAEEERHHTEADDGEDMQQYSTCEMANRNWALPAMLVLK